MSLLRGSRFLFFGVRCGRSPFHSPPPRPRCCPEMTWKLLFLASSIRAVEKRWGKITPWTVETAGTALKGPILVICCLGRLLMLQQYSRLVAAAFALKNGESRLVCLFPFLL